MEVLLKEFLGQSLLGGIVLLLLVRELRAFIVGRRETNPYNDYHWLIEKLDKISEGVGEVKEEIASLNGYLKGLLTK